MQDHAEAHLLARRELFLLENKRVELVISFRHATDEEALFAASSRALVSLPRMASMSAEE